MGPQATSNTFKIRKQGGKGERGQEVLVLAHEQTLV